MATVYKIALFVAGGDRTPTETYWSNEPDFQNVVVLVQELITMRKQVLAIDGKITGFRISGREDTLNLAPSRNSRVFAVNVFGPDNYAGIVDPAIVGTGNGTGAIKSRLKTTLNYRSQAYNSITPTAVVAAYTPNFGGVVAGSDAAKAVAAWGQKWNNVWKPYLQNAGKKWAMKVIDRDSQVPSPNNTIIAIQSAMLGANEIVQLILAGNQVSNYPIGSTAAVKGSRIFGSRRRPLDRQYRVGDVALVGGNTVISVLCSDATLVTAKWCAYGNLYPVRYKLDTLNSVADTSELIGTAHRRGNKAFFSHRGSPRIRLLRA